MTNLNQICFISQNRLALFCVAALVSGFSLCACTNAKRIDPAVEIAQAPNPESLAAFDGNTRTPIGWEDVLNRVANANAVFVGETHDDASAHRVEHALVNAFYWSLRAIPNGFYGLVVKQCGCGNRRILRD